MTTDGAIVTGAMTAAELIASLRPLNPGRRFAVSYDRGGTGEVVAVAIDKPGGWGMFAAAYIPDQWVTCLIPSIQERNEWEEVTE